jgi:hypothetical protein
VKLATWKITHTRMGLYMSRTVLFHRRYIAARQGLFRTQPILPPARTQRVQTTHAQRKPATRAQRRKNLRSQRRLQPPIARNTNPTIRWNASRQSTYRPRTIKPPAIGLTHLLLFASSFVTALALAHRKAFAEEHKSINTDIDTSEIRKLLVTTHTQTLLKEYGEFAIVLTENEIEQLTRLVENKYVTPEARDDPNCIPINFEIKRCITRVMSFQLLLTDKLEIAYALFIKDQPQESCLSFKTFKELSASAKTLTPKQQAIQRTVAFLTSSTISLSIFSEHGLPAPKDSEQFLTSMSHSLIDQRRTGAANILMPATNDLSQEQLNSLMHIFLKDTHIRHIMYTEGGANMLKELQTAIKEKRLTKEQFAEYEWRWRINLFGFQAGCGAKYYSNTTHQLFEVITTELIKLFDYPDHHPLVGYLMRRAEMAGFSARGLGSFSLLSSYIGITGNDLKLTKQFFGHLVAMFDITDSELGARVQAGFERYQQSNPENNLVKQYAVFIVDDSVKTPTYTPAIYKSARQIFAELGHKDDIELATQFTCQVLASLHQLNLSEQIIACRNLAWKPNLAPHIKHWLEHNKAMEFALHPETQELTPTHVLRTPSNQP